MKYLLILMAASLFGTRISTPLFAQEPKQTREQKVRGDKERVEKEGFWIYNDLPTAFRKAKQSGKPILVVLRCLPCEECVKLDDDLVDRDPVIRPLLEKFVCVRVVSTNGLDLSLFQYDTDQSFAAFMLNADRTIYGRFGTRSHRTEWIGDVSLPGLAEALKGALELHATYPAVKESLKGKTGPEPLFARPELYPTLREKYKSTIDYSGDVVKSCIHCHQIGDAQRDYYRHRNEPIPEEVLYPYPHPKSIGLVLDASKRATVTSVAAESLASHAGIHAGDQIVTMNGQPMLSMADVQWVLHSVPADGGTVPITYRRDEQTMETSLKLPEGWRRAGDLSWRASIWGLRRMATGGLVLESLDDKERQQFSIPDNAMALRVRYVGQYGEHAAGKQAGFKVDDLIVSVDDRTDLLTETAFISFAVTEKKVGDVLNAKVRRGDEVLDLKIPMQM
ncbi:MAG: thioredoxin family protein [Planctomyces sp.]|nr:thioredoxin family protein [Planctomyces sp.]